MKIKLATDRDFDYALNYDYDTDYSACDDDDDYYRNSTIVNVRTSKDVNAAFHIMGQLTSTRSKSSYTYKMYLLERFISCAIRERLDEFDYNIIQGYYGEEFSGFTIPNGLTEKVNAYIKKLNNIDAKNINRKAVEEVLIAEYGYLLPHLTDKEWFFDKVELKNIVPGNSDYRSLDNKTIKDYGSELDERTRGQNARRYLTCLCRKIGDKYILVDGYHRFAAANKSKAKHMLVMWCDGE